MASSAAFAQDAPASLEVKATSGSAGVKPAIREFVQSVQRDLHGTLGFPYPGAGDPGIAVEIGFARPFALSSCHRVVRYRTGRVGAVVMIPDPYANDWSRLRYDVVAGIFRSELHNRAARNAKVTEPPVWFVAGLAAASDPSRRNSDFEQTYALWSHASLDGASALFAAGSRVRDLPCVAAQLAAWCADRADCREGWGRLLDALAAGEPWTSVTVGRAFMDTASAAALDSMFDEWIHARSRRIFAPGITTHGAIDRFRFMFTVFADEVPLEMRPFFRGKATLPLSSYAENPDWPGARKVLAERAMRIRAAAVGRDRDFAKMCSLYADAIETSARKNWVSASAKWRAAEETRLDLEARAAAGETIGEKR